VLRGAALIGRAKIAATAIEEQMLRS